MRAFLNIHKFLSGICAVTLCILTAFSSMAASAPSSSVIVAVEAFTVAGGFILYPTEVQISLGDTGASIIEKALGANKINKGNGFDSPEISSVAFADTDYCSVESEIGFYLDDLNVEYNDAVTTAGWIANDDFTEGSAWTFVLNNKRSTTSLDNYVPQNGDVMRISFSIYNNGADLAIDSTIFSSTNRDSLYKYFAALDESDYNMLEDVAIDLTVSQTDINDAIAALEEELDGESIVTAAPIVGEREPSLTTRAQVNSPQRPPGAEPAPTGVSFALPAFVLLASGAVMLLSIRKK
ncbi:MAG: hypothetical protein LBR74_06000 [Eubacterium sp.]|nr:hypothetical protein [Eubacterium sp.]